MEKGANASYKWTRAKKDLCDIKKFIDMINEFKDEFEENKKIQKKERILEKVKK